MMEEYRFQNPRDILYELAYELSNEFPYNRKAAQFHADARKKLEPEKIIEEIERVECLDEI
jgi:hypothetical protein